MNTQKISLLVVTLNILILRAGDYAITESDLRSWREENSMEQREELLDLDKQITTAKSKCFDFLKIYENLDLIDLSSVYIINNKKSFLKKILFFACQNGLYTESKHLIENYDNIFEQESGKTTLIDHIEQLSKKRQKFIKSYQVGDYHLGRDVYAKIYTHTRLLVGYITYLKELNILIQQSINELPTCIKNVITLYAADNDDYLAPDIKSTCVIL